MIPAVRVCAKGPATLQGLCYWCVIRDSGVPFDVWRARVQLGPSRVASGVRRSTSCVQTLSAAVCNARSAVSSSARAPKLSFVHQGSSTDCHA